MVYCTYLPIILTHAVSDTDYQSTTMMKTFSTSNVEQCLNVVTLPDDVYEYWEIFNVTLTLVSPMSNRIMITRNITDVEIMDEDSRSITYTHVVIVKLRICDHNTIYAGGYSVIIIYLYCITMLYCLFVS